MTADGGPVGRPTTPGRLPDLRTMLVEQALEHAMFTVDVDGRITTWNRGAERLFGHREAEILGRHVSVTHPGEGPDEVDRLLAIATAAGRLEEEGWRVRRDGGRFWANTVVTALRGPDDRLVGFGHVTRDRTDRKAGEDKLRESEERFRLLVTAVADYAIFLLATDGTVMSWNVGAERLKGYRADEIIGRHFSTFYTAGDRADGLPDQGLRRALSEGRWESEGWRVRRDGSRFWADVVITSLHGTDGTHRGFAKVTRDLTERKRNEDALRGILERERQASARLRELDRMKTDLVAIVAHDLQAPVRVLRTMSQLLADGWAATPDHEKLALVRRVAGRADALGALVDDVFDLARIEAGELGVETVPFDLNTVVSQVAADQAVSSPERTIVVDAEDDGQVVGDPRRAWQVVANLVSNAVKYSPAHEPVELSVGAEGDEVIVTVTDHGPGIPPDQRDLLFVRFGRLPQTSRTPGSGLGLFIAKSLAEAQGGRLWLESTVGVGSVFRFALPRAPGPA